MERRLTTELYLHFSRVFDAFETEGRKDLGDILILLNGETIWERFSAELRDIVLEYLASAAEIGSHSAESQLGIDLNWKLLNPRVSNWADRHAAQLVTAITDTTRRNLNRVITDGLAQGNGWRQLRDAFEREGFSRARAERIARTEVIRAHSQGSTLGYEESGVVRGVKWLDGQAGACPLCRDLHNQTRKLGEPFYRDTFGDGYPPRHPNCRCATAPITLDMAAQLPDGHPLKDNRRGNVAELTDDNTFVEIGGVRVTGERRRHWRERHPEVTEAAENDVLSQVITGPTDIVPDKKDSAVRRYYKMIAGKLWQASIVVEGDGAPFILTFHRARRVK